MTHLWRPRPLLAVVAIAVALPVITAARSAPPAAGEAAAAAGPTSGRPAVRLVVAQRAITVESFHGQVYLDPGVWVAAQGSPLEFDVWRSSYTRPVRVTQVIRRRGGVLVRRPWPRDLLDGWTGLRDFLRIQVRDAAGAVVAARREPFCPNSFDAERVALGGLHANHYPLWCQGFDPFQKGMVWGLQSGWAVDSLEMTGGPVLRLAPGRYQAVVSITSRYARLLHVPARDATASVSVTVVKGRSRQSRRTSGAPPAALARASAVPTLRHPPPAALPDLVALPAWQIATEHAKGRDLLSFAATVWVGGRSQLDVEGFRVHGSAVMRAYQYFWRNGKVIGRARAGTMGFDPAKGHDHWHFRQFAAYRLLNSAKSLVVRSHKVGFCIAPTDPVDLLLHNAVWQPVNTELTGACGVPSALWVQEVMPVGWGDTYIQQLAGQSFDITNVPNGTYYIEVAANPLRLLHESSTRNDVSLRKVILGGTPGHRTVKVPAWHGIDPEG